MIWTPRVTVACIVEREGRFLLVEEQAGGRLVFNQPAGHLDEGEDLLHAVVRETREETAWEVHPEALVGVYLWRQPDNGITWLRFAFAATALRHHPDAPLDHGIERACWMSHAEIAAAGPRLRSPLVLRAVEDYLSGARYPVDLLSSLLPKRAAAA